MTIQEMKDRKTELGLTNEMISRASGVPLSTIQKIFGGTTRAPRKLTLEAIIRVLNEPEKDVNSEGRTHCSTMHGNMTPCSTMHDNMVHDSAPMYHLSNEENERLHTLDDYYALPDDQRVELIDGKFYEMTAPTGEHQLLIGELHVQFYDCIHDHNNNCKVYLSPYDVRLDRDNYTMVQPDLVVVCQEYDHLGNPRFEGAPDLVIEILSPSTRSKDMFLKLNKYFNAGVREYWIVDPKNRTIIVHFFEEDDYCPKTYTFDDKIPVGISKGFCIIDFSRIKRNIYDE